MVRALMRWRRELNRSLDDELDALDHHRDSFVAGTARLTPSGIGGVDKKLHDVSRFERWLSEERRRLVRVNELRCEEYWRRAVTAKDDQGRTPIHWAATGTAPIECSSTKGHGEAGLLCGLLDEGFRTVGRCNLTR